MASFGARKALVVERFDRLWAKDGRLIRLPQEDCAQALSVPPTRKYQNEGGPGIAEIMGLLRGSDEATQDRLDFFKANILFWLSGATDGHAKNFSLALMPDGRFRLTPFYDVLTVQPTLDAHQLNRKDFKLAMRFGKSNHYKVGDIIGRHIMETGVESGLSRKAIADLFADIHASAESAMNNTFAALPVGFPEVLVTSIRSAVLDRLRHLKP
ncbi:MAG: HipA domain-containing protein, partial [Marinomonas sp.]